MSLAGAGLILCSCFMINHSGKWYKRAYESTKNQMIYDFDRMSFVYLDITWWSKRDHCIHILISDENKFKKESTNFHIETLKIVAKWIMLILLIHLVWLRRAIPHRKTKRWKLYFLHEILWFIHIFESNQFHC